MLAFLAHTLEQLDLALEHVRKSDANSARFAVMLTDNALELVLHQVASDERRERSSPSKREKAYDDAADLEAALGRHFDAKLRFARRRLSISDEESQTISVCHDLRNHVYHIGLRHEAVLPAIAKLYFDTASTVLGRFKTSHLSYSPNMQLPERSEKYFGKRPFGFRAAEEFQAGCIVLAEQAEFDALTFVNALADHVANIIEEQDRVIDVIARGGPKEMSRDEAIVETEAWHIMFNPKAMEETKKRAKKKVDWKPNSPADVQKWLLERGALRYTRDPVPDWRKRETSLMRWRTAGLLTSTRTEKAAMALPSRCTRL